MRCIAACRSAASFTTRDDSPRCARASSRAFPSRRSIHRPADAGIVSRKRSRRRYPSASSTANRAQEIQVSKGARAMIEARRSIQLTEKPRSRESEEKKPRSPSS